MILFHHFPKTAGTAFRVYVQDNIGSKQAACYGDDATSHPAFRWTDYVDAERIRVTASAEGVSWISAHHTQPFLDAFPDADVLCCLRDPVERVVSAFLHLKRLPPGRQRDADQIQAGALDLMGYAAAHANHYTRTIRRCRANDRCVELVFQDRIDDAVAILNGAAGWKGRLQTRNLAPSADELEMKHVIAAQGEALRVALSEDVALYEAASQAWYDGPGRTSFEAWAGTVPKRYDGLDAARLTYRLRGLKHRLKPDRG